MTNIIVLNKKHLVFLLYEQISDLSFFRLLSECSQRKVFGIRVYGAIEELAIHLADFSYQRTG